MSIVQNCCVDVPSDLQTKLDRTKEKLELCIIKKEKEYAVLWNNCHLKTTYKNLFDSIKSNRAHAKLHDLSFKNANLRSRLFENNFESVKTTSGTSVTPHVDKPKLSAVTPLSKKLHASMPSHFVPQLREFNVVKHGNVIAPGKFKINPSQTPRVDLVPNKQSSASIRTNPITNSQRHVIVKENVSSNMVTASSIGLVHTARTRRPHPKGNIRNTRVPSASKSSEVKKVVTVEDYRRTLLLSKNQKTMSSECNNIKLAIQNDKSKIVCDTCCPNLSVVRRLGLFQAYDREHQASHQLCVEVFRNCMIWERPHCYYFRRNTCFIRDLDGVDLLKGNRSTNLYTINLHEMASASLICLMARATPTKSWLWHQRLSHLNFDTINDLAKNDLVSGLPKFKYAKGHLCPFCEEGKSKRVSHPPKLVSNSKQRLHLLHMDLCGPMCVASINGKWYVLKISVCLQAPVIIVRTDNRTEFKNQVLKEYFDSVGITHETSATKTPQQNGVVERINRTLVEDARTILIFSHGPLFLYAEAIATVCYTKNRSIIHRCFNKTPYELIQGRKPDISYLYVFGALCYPKNDREDIGKLGAKGDIGFFIEYSINSVAYGVYNQRTKKIMETMNVISELELTYALSTITPQRPSEHDLDILFEPLHNEYLGGRPAEAPRAIPAAPVLQNLQAPNASMSFQDSTSVPSNSSNTPVSSHNVDATSQQHAQQQRNLTLSPTTSVADNVSNAVFEGDLFVNPFGTPSTDHVYKLKKALYGLKQASRAWYDELSMFFLQIRFFKGTVDLTLFTTRFDDDILVKYGLNTYDIVGTLMDIKDKLDLDQIRTPIDAMKYRSMIGALMYLTSSRPDIIHATCIKILDHKHAEGTVKNSQDNKALRLEGYNAWQNGGIQGTQNTIQNAKVQIGGNQNWLIVVPWIANQNGTGMGHIARNCTARLRRRDAAYLQTQLLIAQKEEVGIKLQAEEFDFMATVGDLDEIKEVNANCILMANLQQASTSGTQHDKAPVYDTDGSAEYTDLLEPIPEPQLVPQNENHVTSVAPSMVQSGGTIETSFAPNEETHAH
nr:retrovirus-related Pol polyprotein from transposon TNT 1-94 [Tanacetum cinerariifolium]